MHGDSGCDPCQLVGDAGEVLTIVVEEFKVAGLTMNLGSGKTEFMFKLVGPGAKMAKKRIPRSGGRIFTTDNVHSCGVVEQYKHVGTVRTPVGNPVQDASVHVSSAMSAYTPLADKVFANRKIDCTVRLRLAAALVFSRLFFGTETWRRATGAAITVIRSVYMRVLRRIAGAARFTAVGNLTDGQVLTQLGVNSADIVMRQRRLAMLA